MAITLPPHLRVTVASDFVSAVQAASRPMHFDGGGGSMPFAGHLDDLSASSATAAAPMSWHPGGAFLPPLDPLPPKDDMDPGMFLQQLPGMQEQSLWPVRRSV